MADDSGSNNNGRTLGGSPAEPLPEGWGGASRPRVGRVGDWNNAGGSSAPLSGSGARIATLGSLGSQGSQGPPMPPMGGHAGHGHGHDDDEDDDEEDQGPQSFFAGGERSGLSVEGPGRPRPGNSTVRDILRKAAQASQDRMGGLAGGQQEPARNTFFGGGHTLGSDEVESQFIPDPDAPSAAQEEETAIRQITFWRDGFSVEDGPLMRYDDPQHARLLDDINTGHAPPSILNVRVGQPVELRVLRRLDEDYVATRSHAAFGGAGNRLGAAVPGEPAGAAGTTMPGSFPGTTPAAAAPANPPPSVAPVFQLDTNAPTTNIQIRLADGSRLVARMNLTHTVGDIRGYINASHAGMAARQYTIGTTFPNRVLEDNSQTIKDAGLANSVVVQRWV